MIPHAVIRVYGPNQESIGICVTNFPEFDTTRSSVELYFPDTDSALFLEDLDITNYLVDNKYGVLVDVRVRAAYDDVGKSKKWWVDRWARLVAVCVRDPENQFTFVYPTRIDLGLKFPLPSDPEVLPHHRGM